MSTLIEKIITFLVVIMPLLLYYNAFSDFPLVIMLEIVILILVMFLIMVQHQKFSITYTKEFAILISWLILTTLIMVIFAPYTFFSSAARNNLIFMIIIFLSLFLGLSGIFNFSYGIRIYRNISIVVIVYLTIQIFFYYFLNIHLRGNLPLLDLNEIYYPAFYYWPFIETYGYVRLSSLFSEPSHFALYLLPFLCMKLFGYKNMIERNFSHAIIITIFIILSTSGNGMVASGIVWSSYFIIKGGKNKTKRLAVIILGIIIMFAAYNILMNFTFFSDQVSRLFVSTDYGTSKAEYRIYRGVATYLQLPLLHQLVGTGYVAATPATQYYGISTQFDVSGAMTEYYSAILQVLIYSGFIGLVLFGSMFKKLYGRSELCGKILIIVFLALCISSSIFMDTFWQLYMLLIFAGLPRKKFEKSQKGLLNGR